MFHDSSGQEKDLCCSSQFPVGCICEFSNGRVFFMS